MPARSTHIVSTFLTEHLDLWDRMAWPEVNRLTEFRSLGGHGRALPVGSPACGYGGGTCVDVEAVTRYDRYVYTGTYQVEVVAMTANAMRAAAAHSPVDPAAALDLLTAEIAQQGSRRAVGANLRVLRAALHRAPRPGRTSTQGPVSLRGGAAESNDLIGVFTELVATTLTERQCLELAQVLIGTVTGQGDRARDRAREAGRESILESFELLDSMQVAEVLAPTSRPTRSVAQKRRKAGELIGLPVSARPDYRYPAFQLDRERHRIHPLVRHANRRLDVEHDPYGAASWWLTPVSILDGRSPLEDLEAGELTDIAIDNILDAGRRGM